MPTVTFPAWLRLTLYLTGALALIANTYLLDKSFGWWGSPESAAVTGVVALVNMLAAGKVTVDSFTLRKRATNTTPRED